MAHQAGPLRLKGTLGDLSFYHNKQYGYLVRQKGGPNKNQVANSERFARTRENAAEFANAVKSGQLIRGAIKAVLGFTGDSNVSQRLTGLLVRIGKSDSTAVRGMRSPASVFDEPYSRELLRSFLFYKSSGLSTVYMGQTICNTDSGLIVLNPGSDVTSAPASLFFRAPKGASHVRIKAGVVQLNFEKNLYAFSTAPVYIGRLDEALGLTEFECGEGGGEGFASPSIIGIIAVEFMQEQGEELYLLEEGRSLGVV